MAVSAVQMVAYAIGMKGNGTELVSGEASTVCQVFSSLSLSLCPSPSPSLSLHSLSLPQVADLDSVRVAPLRLSCCSAAGAHHGLWYVVLLCLAPLAAKTLAAQRPLW